MNTDLSSLRNVLVKEKKTLATEFSVKNIGIFGSFAIGNNRESSDVDVLVEFFKPIGMFKFIELEEYLSNIFHKKVDLVTKNALKPLIKDEILNEVVYV